MANRMKDDDKNEKIIRGLLKLPANRRCINCNSLGPQYVCTNFWTFICTNCSGLHREFTHRVKSVSMAKFSSQEVSALQEGGNERARGIFFKEWDPQRHSFPDSSHLDRLRDFIKHVYVERRYAGGKKIEGPPMVKGTREDYDENRKSDTYRGGSRSPPYDDSYERRYGERPGSAGSYDDRNSRPKYDARSPNYDARSPGNNQGDYRSPNRSEMGEEIHRDAGNEVRKPKSNDNRNLEGLPKAGVSDHQKGVYISSPPMVRPVREILGGDVPPLQVGEPLKIDGGKAPSIKLETQGTTSTSVSNNGNSVELKRVNSGSLIDFSADSEPPVVAGQESFPQQAASTPANGSGWASFDVSNQKKAPETVSNTGNLESVLAQLSVHTPAPVVNNAISPTVGIDTFPNNGGQWPAERQQPSHFPVASSRSTNPPVQALINSFGNQVPSQLLSPFATTIQSSTAVLDGQSSLPVMHPSQGSTSVGNSGNPLEAKPSGRKELPMDLFAGMYPTSHVPYPGWRIGPSHGMVYGMQYPATTPVTAFHSPVSTNPFDLANESASAHNAMIHTSASLRGPLPNMSNLASLPNSSKLAAFPSQWTPPQQFFYPSSASPGPYMGQQFQHDRAQQQLPSNLFPAMNQGAGERNEPTRGISASNQIPAPTNSHLSSLSSFVPSVGGNPFG